MTCSCSVPPGPEPLCASLLEHQSLCGRPAAHPPPNVKLRVKLQASDSQQPLQQPRFFKTLFCFCLAFISAWKQARGVTGLTRRSPMPTMLHQPLAAGGGQADRWALCSGAPTRRGASLRPVRAWLHGCHACM